MDPMLQKLLEYGIAGIFIAYLIWCCRDKDKRYDALALLTNQIQERRATERAENAKVMAETAEVNEKLAASITILVETVSAQTRALGIIPEPVIPRIQRKPGTG